MLPNKEQNIEVYSGWELYDKQRKRLVYSGGLLTTIFMEKLNNKGAWISVFKQTLTYTGDGDIETITGSKL